MSSGSAASSQIERATAKLRQAHDTISMQSEQLSNIAKLKISIRSLQDTVEFYEASEESLKIEPATATM